MQKLSVIVGALAFMSVPAFAEEAAPAQVKPGLSAKRGVPMTGALGAKFKEAMRVAKECSAKCKDKAAPKADLATYRTCMKPQTDAAKAKRAELKGKDRATIKAALVELGKATKEKADSCRTPAMTTHHTCITECRTAAKGGSTTPAAATADKTSAAEATPAAEKAAPAAEKSSDTK